MNKYYTPDISDIYVGYECEKIIQDFSRFVSHPSPETYKSWIESDDIESEPHILTKEDVINFYLFDGDIRTSKGIPIIGYIRTPFLTKEQIEAEGWREIHYREYLKEDSNGRLVHFFNGNQEDEYDSKLLSTFSVHNRGKQLYQGECLSINEFRKIVKMLGI